jgi:hypothetical protein
MACRLAAHWSSTGVWAKIASRLARGESLCRSGPSSATGLPLTVIVKLSPVLGAPQHRADVVAKFTLWDHRHAHSVAICYGGSTGTAISGPPDETRVR